MTVTTMAPAIALIFLVGSLVIVPTMNIQKAYAAGSVFIYTPLECAEPASANEVRYTIYGSGWSPDTFVLGQLFDSNRGTSTISASDITDSEGNFQIEIATAEEPARTQTWTFFVDVNGNTQLDSEDDAAEPFTIEITGTECDEEEKDPVEQIQDLKSTINSMTLSKSLKTSLLAPLTNAEKILTDKDPTNDADACVKLNDFITSVNSKTGTRGGLTSAQAEELLSQAQAIKEAIGC